MIGALLLLPSHNFVQFSIDLSILIFLRVQPIRNVLVSSQKSQPNLLLDSMLFLKFGLLTDSVFVALLLVSSEPQYYTWKILLVKVFLLPLYGPGSHFWLSLCPDGTHFSGLFLFCHFNYSPSVRSGINTTSTTFKNKTNFSMVYLHYDNINPVNYDSVLLPSHCIYRGCYLCTQ